MKPLAQQTLYEILEVPPDSTSGEIEAAWARAREVYAPGSIVTYSLMSPEDAELLASRLEEARTTLLDPAARARYDAAVAGAPVEPRSLPPVIPALALAPPPRDVEREPGTAPAPSAPPAASEGPRPTPAPIRLERPVAGPTRTPIPLRTPLPAPPPPAPPRDVTVPDATAWTGEVLRQLREARGISIQQISERTKVTRHHIENIEADRYGALPAPVYLRGILLGIARELRLDGQKVARSYLERMAAAAASAAPAPRR